MKSTMACNFVALSKRSTSSALSLITMKASIGASAPKLSLWSKSSMGFTYCGRNFHHNGTSSPLIAFSQVSKFSTTSVWPEGKHDSNGKADHKKCLSCSGTNCHNKKRLLSSDGEFVRLQKEQSLQQQIRDNVRNAEEGKFDTMPDPGHLEHFKKSSHLTEDTSSVNQSASAVKIFNSSGLDSSAVNQSASDIFVKDAEPPMGTYTLPHPIWSEADLHGVKITHTTPEGIVDRMAYSAVQLLRGSFDIFSGFKHGERSEFKWLKRIIFLETVAAVPGMVAAMMRHMISLRRMQRDHGWIHTLLEEAENERMHLMTALQLKQPSWLFRTSVIASQGVFVTMFGIWYIFSPRFCHRFVGYLEEEAVKTYTKCIEDIKDGPMKHWQTQPAPDVAVRYWKLSKDAKMLDVILAIRADEAHHRVVNHTLASLKSDQFNPYRPGQ